MLEALQQASDAAAAAGDGLAAESPFRQLVLRKRKRKDLRAAVSSLKVCAREGGRGGGVPGGGSRESASARACGQPSPHSRFRRSASAPMKATLPLCFPTPFLSATHFPFPSPLPPPPCRMQISKDLVPRLPLPPQQSAYGPSDLFLPFLPFSFFPPTLPFPSPPSRLQISKELVSKLPPPPQQPADQELLFVMRPDPNRLPASAVTSLLQVWKFEFEFHIFEIWSDAPCSTQLFPARAPLPSSYSIPLSPETFTFL